MIDPTLDDKAPLALYGEGGGKGGGGSQSTPQEAPNTLRATSKARIIDLLGEGPIGGLVNGLQSVFLDGTPLQASNGEWNFEGVTVHTRNGEPDQEHIPGFPAVEATTDVAAQVKQSAPVIRTINTADADAVRVTVQLSALSNQNVENGNLNGSSVEIAIDVRRGTAGWQEKRRDTIEGKTTSPYQRSYRIELDGVGPWDVRVRRLSADDETVTVSNDTYWAYYTTIIDAKLSYPDSALIGLEVDAQQFGNQIPPRAYEVYGLVVQVPDNYDPVARTYSGFWSGNFKLAWTDNPAWCYHDLAMKKRYGAGLRNIDKWELYRLGQYCDELVPDGFGGEEPRFTFNTVMADEVDAMRAMHTVASAFRGMTYWGTNTVMPVADMPSDPVKLVTPANVIDGEFVYEGTALKARHSVAHVSYNDPDDQYKLSVEPVEDAAALEQFGYRKIDVDAVACTSRAQAHRLGKWILASERAETETVSYRCSVDHADVRPGDIIKVSDPSTAGARLGGRLTVAGRESLTLDQVPEQVGGSNWFIDVMLPNGRPERRPVASFSGNQVRLSQPLSAEPVLGAMWILSSLSVEPRQFRVLANSENTDDEGRVEYHITALEHDPTKYARIEYGIDLDPPSYTLLPRGPVSPPYSLTAQAFKYLAGGTEHQGMTISWTPSDDPRVQRYIVEVQGPSDLRWRTVYTETGTSVDLRDVEPGQWMIRVRGVTGAGTASAWSTLITNIAGLLLPVPPDSVDVEVGTFTITLRPRGAYPGQMYEFWRSNVALETALIESNAVLVSVSTTLVDAERTPGTTYYYYIRGVNAYGVSSWYPVQATTEISPEKILQVLSDQIREEHLYQKLGERIDKIDGPESLDGSVAQRIADSSAAMAQRIADESAGLAEQIANEVEARGDELEEVRNELIDGFEDEARARAAAIEQETENRTVAVTQLSEQVETDFGLLGLQLNAIAAAYDATAASIYSMTQIRIDDAEVVATQLEQLSGRVEKNDALILDERQIRVNQFSSLATQVGILSARLDARPSLNSGFEPGADFNAWVTTAGNTISAVTSGAYSGLQSALVTSTTSNASPNSGGVRRIIGPETAAEFAGNEIRLAIYARQPDSGAASEFALAYQVAGQSVQWHRFTPGTEWAFYDVVIDVPEGPGTAEHAIAIWGDTSGTGKGVQVDRLLVTFAETDIPEVTAAIEQIQQALVDQEQALAQELIGFSAQLGTNTSAIQEEITTRATLTDALANSVQTLQSETQDNAAAIVAEREAWSTETEALGRQLEQLVADVGDGGLAAIEEERRVRAAEDEYLASIQRVLSAAEGVAASSHRYSVETRVTEKEAQTVVNEKFVAQLGDNIAAIEEETRVRATEAEALSQRITNQAAKVGENTAAINSESTARATQDEALAKRITEQAARVGENAAAISSESTTRATQDEALSKRITDQSAKVGENAAAITNESTTRATADQALSQRITNQAVKVGENEAAIKSEATTRATKDSALAEQISTAQVEFNKELASVQQATQLQYNEATQRLEAMWTLRIDNNGRVSGIGLADDGEQSTFGVRADRFYFAHPTNGSEVLPMIIDSGQVLLNDALINQLLFTKLRSSDGSLIFRNGRLQAAYIDAANLSVKEAANFTGPVQFNQLRGAGDLAGKNSLSYGEVTGSKPPTNADQTSSNTSANTNAVDGRSANTVKNEAREGRDAKYRVDDWTRPSSTRIDGNKIWTGDAYVDTLEIKGRAVSVPNAVSTAGQVQQQYFKGDTANWFTVQDMLVRSTGEPFDVMYSLRVRTDCFPNGATVLRASAQVRFLKDGEPFFTLSGQGNQEGANKTLWDIPVVYPLIMNLGPGNHRLQIQVRAEYEMSYPNTANPRVLITAAARYIKTWEFKR